MAFSGKGHAIMKAVVLVKNAPENSKKEEGEILFPQLLFHIIPNSRMGNCAYVQWLRKLQEEEGELLKWDLLWSEKCHIRGSVSGPANCFQHIASKIILGLI